MRSLADQETVDLAATPSLEELAAQHFGPRTPVVRVEFGALSHVGKVRANNEDHYSVVRRRRSREVLLTNLPEHFLHQVPEDAYTMAVADGMGGAAFGELASMLAIRTGWDLTSKAFKWHFKMTQKESQELIDLLKIYGRLINRELLDRSRANPLMAGMGTTITGAIVIGHDAFIAHVGDSRAYLFRGGALKQLTHDHTLAQQLVDEGSISSVEDASSFMRHVLVNCLGGNDGEVEVDVRRITLRDGDQLLFCTDGLTDMISDDEIARILKRSISCDEACRALIDLALDHGGRDNVTAVLARFEFPARELPPAVQEPKSSSL